MKNYLFIITLLFGILSFAKTKDTPNTKNSKKLVHTVLFWLNNPDSDTDRQAFEKGAKNLLDNCKFIASSHFGVAADTKKRPVVDASFTYCAVITFESKEDHDNYQIDPLHKKFIENCKHLWKKVVIYDSQPF